MTEKYRCLDCGADFTEALSDYDKDFYEWYDICPYCGSVHLAHGETIRQGATRLEDFL